MAHIHAELGLKSILIPTVTTTHSRLHTRRQNGPYQKAVQKPVSWMHDAPESQNGLSWVDSESFFFYLLKISGSKYKNCIQAFWGYSGNAITSNRPNWGLPKGRGVKIPLTTEWALLEDLLEVEMSEINSTWGSTIFTLATQHKPNRKLLHDWMEGLTHLL